MTPQEEMLARTRELCLSDERVVAALTYGSFARGEGDAHSDIEFVLFFRDETLAGLDRRAWVAQIAPVEVFFPDDFGHYTAIFANLVRGEFHFDPYSQVSEVESWVGSAYFPSIEGCLLKDTEGELARRLAPLTRLPRRDVPERVATIELSFVNLVCFGSDVLARGEFARSLELLNMAHRYLIWMVRLTEGKTDHWPTPSRALEAELSAAGYRRFAACTASLDPAELRTAYQRAWEWGLELFDALEATCGRPVPGSLRDKVSRRLSAWG